MASQQLHRVADADLLNHILVIVVKPVKVTVYLRQVHVLVKVVLQILNRGSLACGTGKTAADQLTELLVINLVETYKVKDTV